MKSFPKKSSQKPKGKKYTFFFTLILLLAIPITLAGTQTKKDTMSHADSYQATMSVVPQEAKPGDVVTVFWNIGKTSQPTFTPAPTTNAATCTYDQKSEEYSCQNGYRCYNDFFKDNTTACQWQQKRNDDGLWYHCDADDRCAAHRGGLIKDQQGFIFIPKTYAQAATLTGAESLIFLAVDTKANTSVKIGGRLYLNCSDVIPTAPIPSGSCRFTIPTLVTSPNLSYVFRIMASDGQTALGEIPITLKAQSQKTELIANPNPCILSSQGTCTTYLSWKATGFQDVSLYVRLKSTDTKTTLVASGNSAEKLTIPWVTALGDYFELKSGNIVIDSLQVQGVPAILTASANPCTVDKTTNKCPNITITWNAYTAPNVTLQVKSGNTEYLVANQGPKSSIQIPWITTATTTFTLYSDTTPLISLPVKGISQ